MADYGVSTSTQRGLSWAMLVLGVLIFLVPFATGTRGNFYANDLVVGVVVFILGAISIWAATNSRMTLGWLSVVNAILGLWTIVAAYYYTGLTSSDMAANVILGIVLLVVGAWCAWGAFRAGGMGATETTTGPRRRMGGV